jgi:hypothetical protein
MRRLATWLLTRAVRVVRGNTSFRPRRLGRPRFTRPVAFEILEERDMPGDALCGFFVAALSLPPRAPLAVAEQALGAPAAVSWSPPPAGSPSREFGAQAVACRGTDPTAVVPWPVGISPSADTAAPAATVSVPGEQRLPRRRCLCPGTCWRKPCPARGPWETAPPPRPPQARVSPASPRQTPRATSRGPAAWAWPWRRSPASRPPCPPGYRLTSARFPARA